MDHTHEVRWFFAGELPGSMRAWLGGPAVDGDPASRTDRYLLLPSDAAGVKWREGRFEVKAAVGPRAPAAFAARATGLRGGWVKWSAGAGGLPRIADTDGDWLDVHKRRWQRGYVLGQRGLVGHDPGDRGVDGVAVELSTIGAAVNGAARRWWSVCYEAFGDPARLTATLTAVAAAHLRERPPPVELPREASRSYPGWLQSLGLGARPAS